MGRKLIEIPEGKLRILAVHGSGAPRCFAEFEPRVNFNMGKKFIETPTENSGFWGAHGFGAPGRFAEFEC